MKVKVKRVTAKEFDEQVTRLGKNAKFIEIPGTAAGLKFKAVFKDLLKQTVLVSWPVDRPHHAQQDFADHYCGGGWPVEVIERNVKNNTFRVVK